jgi:hypothetical protein
MTKQDVAEWLRELADDIDNGSMGDEITFDDIVQVAEEAFEDEL